VLEQEHKVKMAQKGDKDAFVHLIKSIESSMYRVAASMLKSDMECADAIQESILKAYESIQDLREAKYFKTWMIRIVINECKIILKSKNRLIPSDKLDARSQHRVSNSHKLLEIQESVAALDDQLKIIAILYYFEDLPIKEVARILNTPEGTIKSRLYRVRHQLAQSLKMTRERGVCHE
jgi:RNA polymerase sigma factor (sigma-70 family)